MTILTDLELCYVAALADGLRLINDKAEEKGLADDEELEIDALALMAYVKVKGDHLVNICGVNPACPKIIILGKEGAVPLRSYTGVRRNGRRATGLTRSRSY